MKLFLFALLVLSVAPNSAWSYAGSDPTVVLNSDGTLEVFITNCYPMSTCAIPYCLNMHPCALNHYRQSQPGGAGMPQFVGAIESLVMGHGQMTPLPAVARNLDGRLEVWSAALCNDICAGTGRFSSLDHSVQVSPGGSFGPIGNWGSEITHPAAAALADGRLVVFAEWRGRIIYAYQTVVGGNWTGWINLNEAYSENVPSVIANADGRLEVFIRGVDNQVYHSYMLSPSDVNSWSSWINLDQGVTYSPQGVVRNADGRLEVFIRGTNNQLWGDAQVSPGGTWGGWGYSFGVGYTLDRPAAALNADGRVEVFVWGTDNQLYHAWQLSPGGGSGWYGWTGTGLLRLQGKPAVGISSDNLLVVVVKAYDDLYYCHQFYPGSPDITCAPMPYMGPPG